MIKQAYKPSEQEDTAKNQRFDAFGMCLGVGQRQCRPPRSPKNYPSINFQMFTELLDIFHQSPCAVVLEENRVMELFSPAEKSIKKIQKRFLSDTVLKRVKTLT